MSSIFGKVKGFGKRMSAGTVAERKNIRRAMAQAIIKKLKAGGKPVDLQAINQEVLDKTRRKHQSHKPKTI